MTFLNHLETHEPVSPLSDTISPDSNNLVAEDDLGDLANVEDISDNDEITKASALIEWYTPVSPFIVLAYLLCANTLHTGKSPSRPNHRLRTSDNRLAPTL